ncbi:MAG TPA: hypothetical protein DDW31_02995 [candidate division Zixibacteria bacterium]|nr:hypothetical protein [candidate division Zixibacteria bacterium]
MAIVMALLAWPLHGQVSTKLEAHLSMSSPDLNLYFLDPGFLDLNQSHGSVGMMNNPAGLGRTKILDLFLAGSLTKSYKTDMELKLTKATDATGEVVLPSSINLKDQGGLDYAGVAGKAGPFGVGVALTREFGFEAGIDQGEVAVTQSFQYSYQDIIDSGAVSGLTVDVPVNWTVSGTGTIRMNSAGSASFMNRPLFLGAGTKTGPFLWGLGLKQTRIEAVAEMNVNFTEQIDSLRGMMTGTSNNIILDSIRVTSPFDDSIFFHRFTSELTGNKYSIVLGGNMEIPILKLAMSLEQSLPYKLEGSYFNRAGLPSGQPQLLNVDLSGLTYTPGDSAIRGAAVLNVGGVEYERKSAADTGQIEMPGVTSLRASLGLKFWGFRLGINGGMDMLGKDWPALGAAYASAGTSLNIKIVNLRLGLAGRWSYLALEENKLYSTPPTVLFGAGAGIPLPFGEVMTSARINLTNGLLKVSSTENLKSFNPLETVALGAGLRLSF